MALVTWLPEVKRKGAVVLRVDNIGFCYAMPGEKVIVKIYISIL